MALNFGVIESNKLFPKRTIEYWTCSGIQFLVTDNTRATSYGNRSFIQNDEITTSTVKASVTGLRNEAKIEAVFINAEVGQTWTLKRRNISTNDEITIATGTGTTETFVITEPIIDNSINEYYLTSTLTAGEAMGGARITYSIE